MATTPSAGGKPATCAVIDLNARRATRSNPDPKPPAAPATIVELDAHRDPIDAWVADWRRFHEKVAALNVPELICQLRASADESEAEAARLAQRMRRSA